MDVSKHNRVELPSSIPRRPAMPVQSVGVTPSKSLTRQPPTIDRKFPIVVYIVLVLAILLGGYVLFTGPLSTFTHAVVPLSVSEANTTLYAYPLTIKADGKSRSKIDLFVANNDSLPIPNKQVVASATMGSLSPTNTLTDKMGHVSYTLTLNEPVLSTIQFTIDSVLLKKQITIQGE